MSTLPPLWQVIGNDATPGRLSAPGSGDSEISLGDAVPERRERFAHDRRLNTAAPEPAVAGARLGDERRVAHLRRARRLAPDDDGHDERLRPFASDRRRAAGSRRARQRRPSIDALHALVVFRRVEIGERFGRPRRRFRFVTMSLHHLFAAALAFGSRELAETAIGRTASAAH